MITDTDLAAATGEPTPVAFEVDRIDMVSSQAPGSILSFIDDQKFVSEALVNLNILALLVTPELANEFSKGFAGEVIRVDDPRWHYYMLHNHLALRDAVKVETTVAASALIHATAHVDGHNVSIGERVLVEANATILAGSVIEDDVVIRAGAVIGTSGFEHKRTSRGILSVVHDGTVTIRAGAEIGSLAVVGKGFARRHTIVGRQTKIDCHAMIAHGSQVGDRVLIAAGATLAGSTSIEDDVWIGPGAILIDRVHVGAGARIGIGSVVFREVKGHTLVLGNPARQVSGSSS